MFLPEEISLSVGFPVAFAKNDSLQSEYTGIKFLDSPQLVTLLIMAAFQVLYSLMSLEDTKSKLALKMVLCSATIYLCSISSATNVYISQLLEDKQLAFRTAYSSAQLCINVLITFLLLLAQAMVIEQRTEGFQQSKSQGKKLMVAIIVLNTMLSVVAILDTSIKIHTDALQLLAWR